MKCRDGHPLSSSFQSISHHIIHCTDCYLIHSDCKVLFSTHHLLLIWKRYVDIVRCAVHYLLEISNILVWESCPTFLTRHLRLTLLRDKFLHTLAKLRPNFVIRANKNIQFRPHRTHSATLLELHSPSLGLQIDEFGFKCCLLTINLLRLRIYIVV